MPHPIDQIAASGEPGGPVLRPARRAAPTDPPIQRAGILR
jgi:hypothetical protein